jgi:hypothetical protein
MSQFQELFINKSLKFENRSISEDIPVPITDAKFGILNLQAISAPVSSENHDFVFMIDCSASMSDHCSDGKIKMQHIIHTLKNMMLYFKENSNIKNNITIHSFDDKIYKVLERCTVNDKNFNEIIAKIDEIMPRGATDIELALQDLQENVNSIKSSYPSHNICNIFMTDGDATAGNRDINTLASLVDRSVSNAFIGFGIQHDAALLNTISDGINTAYYFIDKLENSGYVYGEILHDNIYKLLKNVNINLENGLVYDYKNNIWVNSLYVGEIVSEANKMYHICSNNYEECRVTITANNIGDFSDGYTIVVTGEESDAELVKYKYRQRTLQHLYVVKDFLRRKRSDKFMSTSIFNNDDNSVIYKDIKKEQIQIQENLANFMKEMKNFMTENNLLEDKIMKNLCDDIYICYQTFGTKFGDMYVSARQTSQGTQRCYTVSHTPDDDESSDSFDLSSGLRPRLLKRRHTRSDICITLTPPPLLHNLSRNTDAPYLTPTSAKIMREISGNNEINYDDSDNSNLDDNKSNGSDENTSSQMV